MAFNDEHPKNAYHIKNIKTIHFSSTNIPCLLYCNTKKKMSNFLLINFLNILNALFERQNAFSLHSSFSQSPSAPFFLPLYLQA